MDISTMYNMVLGRKHCRRSHERLYSLPASLALPGSSELRMVFKTCSVLQVPSDAALGKGCGAVDWSRGDNTWLVNGKGCRLVPLCIWLGRLSKWHNHHLDFLPKHNCRGQQTLVCPRKQGGPVGCIVPVHSTKVIKIVNLSWHRDNIMTESTMSITILNP